MAATALRTRVPGDSACWRVAPVDVTVSRMPGRRAVYTIGHSTRSLPELVAILRAHGVTQVIARGVPVVHLMSETVAAAAVLTPFAAVQRGRVHYPAAARTGDADGSCIARWR